MVGGGGGMEGGAGRTESRRGGCGPGLRREGCAGCRSNPSPSLPALQSLGCLPCSPRLCVRASGGEKDPESAGAAAPGGPGPAQGRPCSPPAVLPGHRVPTGEPHPCGGQGLPERPAVTPGHKSALGDPHHVTTSPLPLAAAQQRAGAIQSPPGIEGRRPADGGAGGDMTPGWGAGAGEAGRAQLGWQGKCPGQLPDTIPDST